MKEIWKDITDFEEHYQISNLGRVRSKFRYVKTRNGGLQPKKQMIRKLNIDKGYNTIILGKDSKKYTFLVHRLVMREFVGFSELTVNHIDGNKLNNKLENLEYLTLLDNMKHRETSLKDKNKFGISLHKRDQVWEAQIVVNGKNHYLGRRKDPEEAYDLFYNAYLKFRGEKPW